MSILRNKKIGISVFFILFFALLAIVFSHNSVYAVNGELKVHYIDVGQADSILVDLPNNEVMLIDGGTYADGETVVNYLKQQGITNIDYMVNTHPHNDHVGGLVKVMEEVVEKDTFTVGNIYMYMTSSADGVPKFTEFTELLDTIRVEPVQVTAGTELINTTVGDKKLIVKCIAPFRLDNSNLNNNSMVLRLEYGNVSYLFMADAEEEEEQQLLASGENLKCDVLKVGHHGAKTSTSQAFLNAVMPKAAVITADTSVNSSGLPAEAILTRLHEAGADIYRTDLLGTIVSTSTGNSFSMNKTPKADIHLPSGAITFDKDEYTYTGGKIIPNVTIKIGGIALKEGIDYICSYKDNVNVGTASVTFIGKGSYYGSKTKNFKITQKSISKATYFHVSDKVYTGSKLSPSVVVKDGSTTLKKDKDYTVSYTKTTNIGQGIVTVKGKGNYSGSKKVYFTIKPKGTSITLKKSLTKGKVMLQWQKISHADGYQILYSVNNKKQFKTFKNVKSVDVTSLTKKLTAGKKYYFYIRSYKVVDGKKIYSDNSTIIGLKHKKSISKCKVSKIKKLKYNGKPRTQKSVVVKIGKKKLVAGTDYKISYKNNTSRGTATIIIKGIGLYRASVKKSFRIV